MKWFNAWDKYRLLLFSQVLFIFAVPFFARMGTFELFFKSIGLSLIFFTGMNALNMSRKHYQMGLMVLIGFIGLNIFLQFSDYPGLFIASFVIFFLLFSFVVTNIIKMLVQSDQIRPSFISGCVAGYLMIGITLAFFLSIMGIFLPAMLTTPSDQMDFAGYLYFSLVTMTTIGYGDIAPLNPFVRMVSVMAGVLSQFYMAVVVAVIVGRLMSHEASGRR